MPILQVNDLAKSFDSTRAVVNATFKVEPGEIYGLLGPNGAGKTTSISMISGLLRADAGQVLVDGKEFWNDPVRAQRIMGVVPQEIAIYEELTGRENLEFWGRLAGLSKPDARTRADELLECLTLSDRASEPTKTFSGGMKRRINLGCALMHRPKLILLDEPTVGIDPQARMSVLSFIRTLTATGTGILYTTHYLEEAESLCSRIGIIDHGQILAEGTLAELQNRLGGKQLFVLEGDLDNHSPDDWPEFRGKFKVIQQSPRQLTVSSVTDRHPSECLKDLLDLPVKAENVTLKRPSLNEVFLQLTGRQLRD